ncbi:MAG TPA: nitronate monooxygenase [Vicinamibacterales bacterium]
MKSRSIEDLFEIELPIIQAPMGGVQGSALAIAVSNAGGLGSLPCALLSVDAIRAELAAITHATTKPYNVNFFCHTPPEPDASRDAAWRKRLEPYYAELGVDPATITHSGRTAFSPEAVDVLSEFKPPVVSFHFGLPARDLIDRVHGWGAKVLSSATTVDEARWLEAHGVDAIIAQGLEAGGHRGHFLSSDLTAQLGTFALVSQVVNGVRVPVIAAGGVADAAGVSAMIAIGAAGVQVGTTYLLCPEATTTPVHRAALASVSARHTAITNVFTGRPARSIVNRMIREVGPMSDLAPQFPLAAGAVLPLRRAAEARDSDDFSSLWAGQNVTGCKAIPAADLTRALGQGVARGRA